MTAGVDALVAMAIGGVSFASASQDLPVGVGYGTSLPVCVDV